MLRENDDQFGRMLKWADASWSTDSLVDLLGQILAKLTDDTAMDFYIVIDRLDCCVRDKLPRVMDRLARMVTRLQDPAVGVRVAVIAETSEGNAQWHSEWLPRFEFDLPRLIVGHDWDQEKLPGWLRLDDSRPRTWSTERAPLDYTPS